MLKRSGTEALPSATEIAGPAHKSGKLPLDVVLIILDELSRDISSTLHLRRLSLLNKSFNALINSRLWRSFRITDCGIPGPRHTSAAQWRQSVRAACNAVTRDACRASYIENLHIDLLGSDLRWSTSSGAIVRNLHRVLLGVPNLKALRLRIAPKTPHAVIPKFVCMLNAVKFPFQLRELECMTSMEPAISLFLGRQHHIQQYVVHPDLSFSWMEPWDYLWKRTLGGASAFPLPALAHFKGPPVHVRSMMQSRRRLESVDVISPLPAYDLEQDTATTVTHPLYRSEVEALVLTLSLPGIPSPVTPPPSFTEHLPHLISHGYCISCSTIKSLKLRRWEVWRTHSLGDINPSALRDFPSLEYLEWTWTAIAGTATFSPNWIPRFVRDCTRSCPNLQQIAFSDHEKAAELIQCARQAQSCLELADMLYAGAGVIELADVREGILQITTDHSFWTFRRYTISFTPLR